MLTRLFLRFSEAPVAIGLTREGHVMEVFSSPDGETWTIVITLPNGTSCMIGAGKHWEILVREGKGA